MIIALEISVRSHADEKSKTIDDGCFIVDTDKAQQLIDRQDGSVVYSRYELTYVLDAIKEGEIVLEPGSIKYSLIDTPDEADFVKPDGEIRRGKNHVSHRFHLIN